jgi:CheY-like chemotaxis protein
MIIEDDENIALALGLVLENSGYICLKASNGQHALLKLESEAALPDLLIVDIMMPVMGGIEFRKKQLANDSLRNIPVIFLTASRIDRSELMELKPYECLLKPIALNDFQIILENFFLAK